MKRLAIILTVLFFIGGVSFAQTQNNQSQSTDQNQTMNNRGMMQGNNMNNNMTRGNMMNHNVMQGNNMGNRNMMGYNMNQGMMGNYGYGMCTENGQMPMQSYMWTVENLPNMRQQLSLTEDQAYKLIDLQSNYNKQQIDYRAELRKERMNTENLLDNNASADQLQKSMEQSAETGIAMNVAAYKTAAKMKDVLTSEQRQTLENTIMQNGYMMQNGFMMQNGNGMVQPNKMQGSMMQNGNGMVQPDEMQGSMMQNR